MAKETDTKQSNKSGVKDSSHIPPSGPVTITIDMTAADVLRLDSEGRELRFDDSIEKFKTNLTTKEVEMLSASNKARHRVSLALYKLNCEERNNPSPTNGLSGNGRVVAPSSRCWVDPETKNPAYHYSFITPDREYSAKRNGAEVVTRETDPKLHYNGGFVSKEGTPTIGLPGHVEQILVRYPKEVYRKNVELPPAIKSQKMNLTYEEQGAAEISSVGGKSFTSADFQDKAKYFKEVDGK